MLEITRKFLDQEIKKQHQVLADYYKRTGIRPLNSVSTNVEFPAEVISARAKLDAFTRTANFINEEVPQVTNTMTNEEALRTATEIFINEAMKENFDWFNAPLNVKDADKLIGNTWNDPQNLVKGFASLVYFWYTFQRKLNTKV